MASEKGPQEQRLRSPHPEPPKQLLDELIRRSGRPAHEVTAAMTTLALKGLIAQKPGGVFAARSSS